MSKQLAGADVDDGDGGDDVINIILDLLINIKWQPKGHAARNSSLRQTFS